MSAGSWEGESSDVGDVSTFAEDDTTNPWVESVDVPSGTVRSLGLSFSEPVNVPALIANGTITQAVKLLDVDTGVVALTAGQFRYDAESATVTITLSTALAVGTYDLRLDGSRITDAAGNALWGGTEGLAADVPEFAAPIVVQANGTNLAVNSYSVPSLADWDGDWVNDLIVGEKTAAGQGKIRIYVNHGTDESPVFTSYVYARSGTADLAVAGSDCQGVFPRLYDWDEDGLYDLVLGLTDGTVQVALNAGSETDIRYASPQAVQVGVPGAKTALDVGSRATFDFADWNDDGRYDLIVGGLDGKVHVFLDTSDSGAPDFRSDTLVLEGTADLSVPSGRASVAVADLSGDGLEDLVSGNTDGQLLAYVNVGTYEAPQFDGHELLLSDANVIDLPGTPRTRPYAFDYNDDWVTDLLVGAEDGQVRLYLGIDPSVSDEPGGTYRYRFLVDAASDANPWTNPEHPLDVNHDDRLTALDALVVINYLNTNGPGTLPVPPVAPLVPPPYLDCTGNGDVTALDVLLVINELNANGPSDWSEPDG